MNTTDPISIKIKTTSEEIDKLQLSVIEECDLKKTIKGIGSQEGAELDRFKQDTRLKKILAIFVIVFTSIWSIAILCLTFLLANSNNNFNALSDGIIVALITETLCLVLGLPLIVITHFFPNDSKDALIKNKNK